MKKIIKHIYSTTGHYVGYKEVPFWYTWINTSAILLTILSVLIGIGIIVALNGISISNNKPSIFITNDLPF